MSLGAADPNAPMRLLVVTGAAVAGAQQLPPSIRALIAAASDVLVVTPTLPTKLQWLTNDTDGYQQVADRRLDAVLGQVQEINAGASAEGHIGADDAITAFTDAVNEFHPDHILIGLHPTDQETWQEHGLADAVIGSFHLPTTVFEVDPHETVAD
jgi:hypothetical protein